MKHSTFVALKYIYVHVHILSGSSPPHTTNYADYNRQVVIKDTAKIATAIWHKGVGRYVRNVTTGVCMG